MLHIPQVLAINEVAGQISLFLELWMDAVASSLGGALARGLTADTSTPVFRFLSDCYARYAPEAGGAARDDRDGHERAL